MSQSELEKHILKTLEFMQTDFTKKYTPYEDDSMKLYIDKAVQFVLALVTFLMINQNIGLMKAVATPVVAVSLAVICTFLPPVVTAYVAAGLVIVHLF